VGQEDEGRILGERKTYFWILEPLRWGYGGINYREGLGRDKGGFKLPPCLGGSSEIFREPSFLIHPAGV